MTEATDSNWDSKQIVFRLLLPVIVVLALYWRSTAIEEHPTLFHVQRYLLGAIRARQIWLTVRPAPLTAGERAWIESDVHGIGEPPVLEALTMLSYLPDDHERPWVAQVLSSGFWLLAGWPVFAIGRRLSGQPLAALAGLAVFYLAPLAVVISQMFQPEALMVLGFVTALAALLKWPPGEGWRNTLICGAVSGAAAFLKPGMTMFLLIAAYAAVRIEQEWRQRRSFWRWPLDPKGIVYALLLVLPCVLYVRIFLPTHLEKFFLPNFVFDARFYEGWHKQMGMTVGLPVVIAGLLGAEAHRWRNGALLPWGLWAGYVATSLFFTWHTATHSYYQTPLIVVAAIGFSGLIAWLLDRAPIENMPTAGLAAVIVVAALFCGFYPTAAKELVQLDRRYDIANIIASDDITRRLGAGTHVLSIDGSGGYALTYYAWLDSRSWPTESDLIRQRIMGIASRPAGEVMADFQRQHAPQYFAISDPTTLRLHLSLEQALLSASAEAWFTSLDERSRFNASVILYLFVNYPRLYTSSRLIVYDLRGQKAGSAAPLRVEQP